MKRFIERKSNEKQNVYRENSNVESENQIL